MTTLKPPPTINIRFDAKVTAFSEKGQFPAGTVAAVIFTNKDGCSHKHIDVDKKGNLSVDYVMQPLTSNMKMTDRVKMHFMFRDNADGQLRPISAGHMGVDQLADAVKAGSNEAFQSNFNSNTVQLNFKQDALTRMHLELQALQNTKNIETSVLVDSDRHVENMKTLDHSVRTGLQSNLEITPDNGGHMFKSMFTAHIMGGEATLYNLYHLDFMGAKNYPPWLATYQLAETLHTNGLTCEQVKALPPDQATRFVGSYAQTMMRSASASRYESDLTLNEDPALADTKQGTMLSEVFKSPFREPVVKTPGKRRTVIADDCEGQTSIITDTVNHLGFMHANLKTQFEQNDNFLSYNSLMTDYFPRDLFGQMPKAHQTKLMDLAMYLGEKIHTKEIEVKVTLVSANAAAYGQEANGPKQVQAHACASLVCNHPSYPMAVMLEGTSCLADEIKTKKVDIGGEFVPMTDVVNTLTTQPPFNLMASHPELDQSEVRLAMHVTHSKGSFYRTAFCQNDTLLGAQIGDSPMSYGIDMEYLADHKIKIHMPVQGKVLKAGEYEELQHYVTARMDEIHPPLIDHHELRQDLEWAPMTLFRGCPNLDSNRPRMTAMYHATAAVDKIDGIYQAFQNEADKFNAEPKHTKIGYCRAFKSMDGVTKVLDLYSDDLSPLQQQLCPIPKTDKPKPE